MRYRQWIRYSKGWKLSPVSLILASIAVDNGNVKYLKLINRGSTYFAQSVKGIYLDSPRSYSVMLSMFVPDGSS